VVYNRTGIAPWSVDKESGVTSATVDSKIEVPQYIQPVLNTGVVDEKGIWQGVTASDTDFAFYHKGNAVPNGEVELASTCDMTGFNDIQLAIRPTNGGNFAITAVMGPDTDSYANLSPVDAAATLMISLPTDTQEFKAAFTDAAQALTANVWNIFYIANNLKNQKLLQFKITNNSGGDSDIEIMYLRVV